MSGTFENAAGAAIAETVFSDVLTLTFAPGAGPRVNAFGIGSLKRAGESGCLGLAMGR